MNQTQPDYHVYQRKPRKCPECGGKKILDYLFGYPNSAGFKQAFEDGTAIIGGCCLDQMFVTDDLVRSWRCMGCGVDLLCKLQMPLGEFDEVEDKA